MEKSICIIPARGGSKRIPRKNIKLFLGKPILQYSIEVALSSNLFDVVMVSTDCQDIANIAVELGASVPFLRSTENADDFSTTYDVINEVISRYKEIGQTFKYTCCLYPTAPFVTAHKLKKAFEQLHAENIEAVLSVVEYSYPIQRSLSLDNEGVIKMNWEENLTKRSQDLAQNYHDVGQFYVYDTQKYLEKKSVFKMKCKPVILSELEVQDIDSLTDWKLAEIKYELRLNNNGCLG